MKRLLGLIMVLLVLLCGCTQNTPDGTTPTDASTLPATQPSTEPSSEPATQPTEPGIYLPESALEQQTSGAVQCYAVEEGGYGSLVMPDGEIILLRNENGNGILEIYTDERMILQKSVSLGENVFPLPEHFCVTEQGISYYDAVDGAMAFRDLSMREIGRMQMPEDVNGIAWASPNWSTIYYAKTDGFYTMDLQTGISRLLREHPAMNNRITGMLAGGTVLRCTEELEDGKTHTILIDASTGAVLEEGSYLDSLVEWNNHYFFKEQVGALLRLRFGTGSEPSEVIWPAENGDVYPLLPDAALAVATKQDDGVMLTYYRMSTGARIGAVLLNGISEVWDLRTDGSGSVRFFAKDMQGKELLCCWDPTKSALQDDHCYKTPCYTLQEPDREGLTEYVSAFTALGERYGVEILIWEEAAKQAPSDHVFEVEFLTQAYEKLLTELEQALAFFPEGFFEQMPGEKLKIVVVRGMTGDTEQGSLATSSNLQYWNGKQPVIALAAGYDTMGNFCHAMAHLIDTQVLSKSAAFYEWNTLNPEGFTYDNNYIINAERTDTTYIEGENRYFIDLFSMSYAKEDRARIFEYACEAGNEEFFQSPVIQEKLRRICKGIRDAFDLEDEKIVFPWEIYLTT
ncbi:MAG: hypothetical protein E7470_03680 [Ruminococcaceae bacterium]|nr:hypothetical protein [Oscillospiraceae bacterium]